MDATKLSSVLWFLVVMVLLTPVAQGQSTRASLRGIVTDEKGGLLPGAVVTARNTETNQKSYVTADDSGYYLIPPDARDIRTDGRPSWLHHIYAAWDRATGWAECYF